MNLVSNREIMQLEWRSIPGWPKYAISNNGDIFSKYANRLIATGRHGYITLYEGEMKRGTSVGVLVLETFVGPCPNGMECCHNDDNRTNNKLSNLRWDTHTANMQDRPRNGKAAMSEADVLEAKILKDENNEFWTYTRLGERYGVSSSAVHYAVTGQTWKYLNLRE